MKSLHPKAALTKQPKEEVRAIALPTCRPTGLCKISQNGMIKDNLIGIICL